MSSRVFQSVIVQMKEATDRMIGVIDADSTVISCSDTSRIGEKWPEAVIKLNSAPDSIVVVDKKTFKPLVSWSAYFDYAPVRSRQAVVLDTNIPAESIEWLADHCAAPLFADPVSTAKAVKLKPVLGKLHTLKPNRIEAELLSGVKITDDASLRKAAETLLDTGLHRVFISLGSDGVFAADRSGQQVQLPPLPGAMVNTTGCGDAFMAAITWAYLQGTDLTDTAKAGLAASVIAMESAETINPAMSEDALRQRAAFSK